MKKIVLSTMFVLYALLTFAQQPVTKISTEVAVGSKKPTSDEALLMKKEEEAHPNITKSMHDMSDAYEHLKAAPDDFGGNKQQALKDVNQAYASLRKALYYRITEDKH